LQENLDDGITVHRGGFDVFEVGQRGCQVSFVYSGQPSYHFLRIQLNDMGQNFMRPQLVTAPGAVVPWPYAELGRPYTFIVLALLILWISPVIILRRLTFFRNQHPRRRGCLAQ
jgi:hypothetical protein